MENVNRLLLENVLPAHVAAHFIGDKAAEVCEGQESGRAAQCWHSLGYSAVPAESVLGAKAGLQSEVCVHQRLRARCLTPWP